MQNKTTEEFIKEVEERFPGEVSFEKTVYTGAYSPLIMTCSKHGDITVVPHNVLKNNAVCACPKCGREKGNNNSKLTRGGTKVKFLERLYKRFPNIKYDFSEAKYINSKTHMKVICHEKDCNGVEHGAWFIKPSNLYTGYGCPKCGNEKSTQERRMSYEDYCKLVSEKYGDIYEVDENSYHDKSSSIKIRCKKHNTYFIANSREFPKCNSHKCPECIKEEIEEYSSATRDTNIIEDNGVWKNDSINFNEEVWVDVLGFEGQYQCSSEGRFKNISVKNKNGEKARDRLIRVSFANRLGTVCLGGKLYSASRKIYESFHKIKLPSGYTHTIDHIDNNVRNNRISNLRLGGSIRENMLNNHKTRAKLSARCGAIGVTPIFDFDDLPGEKWVDAIGYENLYSVSNLGRVMAKERTLIEKNRNVKRVKRKHLMRQCIKYGQYYTLGLIDSNGNHKTHYTHKLVYESFNGRVKDGNQIDHIDSNPLNNKLENLREVTPLENVNNSNTRKKRKSPDTHAGVLVKKLDLHNNVIVTYMSIREAARQNNVAVTSMYKWISGKIDQKRNRLKGYYFKVEENI
jgi:hypothetical protein